MTPGLAFFYGGLVRQKNMIAMLMENVFVCGFLYLVWYFVGFSISFGTTVSGYFGNPAEFLAGSNVGIHTPIMRDGAPFFWTRPAWHSLPALLWHVRCHHTTFDCWCYSRSTEVQ